MRSAAVMAVAAQKAAWGPTPQTLPSLPGRELIPAPLLSPQHPHSHPHHRARRLEKCASLLSRKDLPAVKRRYQQLEVRGAPAPTQGQLPARPPACSPPCALRPPASPCPCPRHSPPSSHAATGCRTTSRQ